MNCDEDTLWITPENCCPLIPSTPTNSVPVKLVQGTTNETMGPPLVSLVELSEGVYRLDWVLKTGQQGVKGNTGATGTVASATVEMIPYDQPATVTVSGIPPNQTMHFKLPKQTPTPGVAGPPGKLQNVRGTKPTDQDAIDLYAEGGPPDTVLLKVLKSSDTVKVSESSDGVIVLTAEQSINLFDQLVMYIGETLNITQGTRKIFWDRLIPEFGENVQILNSPKDSITVNSPGLYSIQFNLNVKSLEPDTFIEARILLNDSSTKVPSLVQCDVPNLGTRVSISESPVVIMLTTTDLVGVEISSTSNIDLMPGSKIVLEKII